MKKKLPYMPLYFGDFLSAVGEWEGEEAALYMLLLGHQWAIGSLPEETAKLCKLTKWDKKNFDKYWPQVSVKFPVWADGRRRNPRLEDHRSKSEKKASANSDSGKLGAKARWQKDGERHQNANGKVVAFAKNSPTQSDSERHQNANGAADSIPNQGKRREEAYQGEEVSEWNS